MNSNNAPESAGCGEQNHAPQRDWILRGFMTGVAFGTIVGLLVVEAWGPWVKGNNQIPVAFCALIGGGVGLVAGVAHRLLKAHQ